MFRRILALSIAVIAASSANQVQAFTVVNDSQRTVFVCATTWYKGHSSPDFESPHWSTYGWWTVRPGQQITINDGDAKHVYVRMTFDRLDGQVIVPSRKLGPPIGQLTHDRKFEIRHEPEFQVRINGRYHQVNREQAVRRLGCKSRGGFYKYVRGTRFRMR